MEMRPPRCPKCGHMMRGTGRERTVRGGTWYVVACPVCLHVHDFFKPRRSKRQ